MTLLERHPESGVERGLSFLVRHLEEPLWPRTISTKATENAQIKVKSVNETLAWFEAAKFLDCKINAYPYREDWAYNLLGQEPYFIFIDLDLGHFRSLLALNRVLNKTLRNTKMAFRDNNIQPTVLWSGNGYHIYLPVKAFVLESESVFADLVNGSECSRKFVQFAEMFLSGNKADECHTKGLSFRNCMVRIPGSVNSKNNEPIRVIQEWNGIRPAINWVLCNYRRYLIQQVYIETKKKKRMDYRWINYWRNK